MGPIEPNDSPRDPGASDSPRPHEHPGDGRRRVGRGRLVALMALCAALSATLAGVGSYAAISVIRSETAVGQGPGTSGGRPTALAAPDAIQRTVAAAGPSVVTVVAGKVRTSGVLPSPSPASTGSVGSGFVVSAGGLILTCNHVVAGAAPLTVYLADGRSVPATLVVADATNDLAVIRVGVSGLAPAVLGDSDSVREGQLAIVVDRPPGASSETVAQGIVSGVGRTGSMAGAVHGSEQELLGLIQTDTYMDAGLTGGPLLDAGGSVVGVSDSAIAGADGVAFAVPINRARALIAAATR